MTLAQFYRYRKNVYKIDEQPMTMEDYKKHKSYLVWIDACQDAGIQSRITGGEWIGVKTNNSVEKSYNKKIQEFELWSARKLKLEFLENKRKQKSEYNKQLIRSFARSLCKILWTFIKISIRFLGLSASISIFILLLLAYVYLSAMPSVMFGTMSGLNEINRH